MESPVHLPSFLICTLVKEKFAVNLSLCQQELCLFLH